MTTTLILNIFLASAAFTIVLMAVLWAIRTQHRDHQHRLALGLVHGPRRDARETEQRRAA